MSNDDNAGAGQWTGASRLTVIVAHWGLMLAYGIVTLVLGVALAVWPGETLAVCAVLIAIHLLLTGGMRVIRAVASIGLAAGDRVLLALTGAFALTVGLLCLRDPLQSLLALSIALGVWWLVSGVVDIVMIAASPDDGNRVLGVIRGALSALVGGFMLVSPRLSLGLLALVLCIWLIAVGVLSILESLRMRSQQAPGVITASASSSSDG